MKFITVLCAIIGVSSCASVQPTFSRSEIHDEHGQYAYAVVTSDGISQSEQGILKLNSRGDDYILVKIGKVKYTDPNGTPIELSYVADETGFHPVGAHLPKPVEPLPAPTQ